jgi:phosphoglycolate phosphatase
MPPDLSVGLSDLDAILFDFDGTLVQQRIDFEAMRQGVRREAMASGVSLDGREQLFTLELVDRVAQELSASDPQLASSFRQRAETAILNVEIEAAEKAEVYPGVLEVLALLRQRGIKVGIVTRNCRQAVELVIARNKLIYDILLTRDDVAHVKPHPEHLQTALRLLEAAPERTCMVGDHPSDVQAGHVVGAWTIGILNKDRPANYFCDSLPNAVLESVAEIPAHLATHPFRKS